MIKEFKDNEIRRSGLIYRSTFNQIKKMYQQDPLLAGELAISAIELVLTGEFSSDDYQIDMLLESNREVNQKNIDSYNNKVEQARQKRITDLKLAEIARLHKDKWIQKNIAQHLGLSQQTVSNRLTLIRKEFPELLQEEQKNACKSLQEEKLDTSKKEFVQSGTSLYKVVPTGTSKKELVQDTSNSEFVQEENACTSKYDTFNF